MTPNPSSPPPEAEPKQTFEVERAIFPVGRTPSKPAFTAGPPSSKPPAPPLGRLPLLPPRPSRWWFFFPPLLFLLGAISVLSSQHLIGYAWDEAYYYQPSKSAAGWTVDRVGELVAGEPLVSWAELKATIDASWEERHEHPSFQKLLSGVSLIYLEESFGPIFAMRFPMALLFGASLVLIYLLGRQAWNPAAGAIAALAYWSMPHVFGHAHFAAMETPLIFAILLFVWCFLWGLESRFGSLLTGIALGLLLATKINGFFLIPPIILWSYIYARPRCLHNTFAMLIIGPIAFLAFWPWLWPDPIGRFLEYINFHVKHQQTAVWFMGQKYGYGGEQAPWTYPGMTIFATTPVSVLALAALGVLGSIVGIFKRPLHALFLLIALVTLGVASLPSTPKYDGVRLFLPVFPFIALLAGGGAQIFLSFGRWLDRKKMGSAKPGKAFKLIAWGFAILLIADGAIATVNYYPHLLSYFNPLVGGIAGAAKDYEVTYWGEAVNQQVLDDLNDPTILPQGASLKVLALHEKCFDDLQRWGKLRADIRLRGEPPYDYHLLLWRRGFFTRPERALADSGQFPLVRSWACRNVPLLTLHKTGEAYEKFWPTMPPDPASPPRPGKPARIPSETPGAQDSATTPTLPLAHDSATTPVLESPAPKDPMPAVEDEPTSAPQNGN